MLQRAILRHKTDDNQHDNTVATIDKVFLLFVLSVRMRYVRCGKCWYFGMTARGKSRLKTHCTTFAREGMGCSG